MTIEQEITVQQLLEAYRAGQRQFKRIELVTADMPHNWPVIRDADISSAAFIECCLHSTTFEQVNLSHVKFEQCNLKCTTFRQCDLSHSQWTDCVVCSIAFTNCITTDLQATSLDAYGAPIGTARDLIGYAEHVARLLRDREGGVR